MEIRDTVLGEFLPLLLGWSTAWMMASTIGMWVSVRRSFWSAFWFMTALWCAINAAIVVWSMLSPPSELEAFRTLLLINAGLGVGYVAAGLVLFTRRKPLLRGFGAAVLIQGGYLMLADLAWWWWLGR